MAKARMRSRTLAQFLGQPITKRDGDLFRALYIEPWLAWCDDGCEGFGFAEDLLYYIRHGSRSERREAQAGIWRTAKDVRKAMHAGDVRDVAFAAFWLGMQAMAFMLAPFFIEVTNRRRAKYFSDWERMENSKYVHDYVKRVWLKNVKGNPNAGTREIASLTSAELKEHGVTFTPGSLRVMASKQQW